MYHRVPDTKVGEPREGRNLSYAAVHDGARVVTLFGGRRAKISVADRIISQGRKEDGYLKPVLPHPQIRGLTGARNPGSCG